jgi:hypothetical protein
MPGFEPPWQQHVFEPNFGFKFFEILGEAKLFFLYFFFGLSALAALAPSFLLFEPMCGSDSLVSQCSAVLAFSVEATHTVPTQRRLPCKRRQMCTPPPPPPMEAAALQKAAKHLRSTHCTLMSNGRLHSSQLHPPAPPPLPLCSTTDSVSA